MKISNFFHIVANRIQSYNNAFFTFPVEKQKSFLEKIEEPRDDIERSYNQYRCQMYLNKNPIITACLNLASFPLIIYLLLKKGDLIDEKAFADAVFFSDGKPTNIIPKELSEKITNLSVVETNKEYFSAEDKEFILRVWKKVPFSFHFIFKCLLKIRYYSYEIEKSNPSMIISCNEYSFACSVMTAYCQQRGIKHINVQHGEKLYCIRDSFFRFDKCYVWDEYYRELLISLRASKDQFVIAVPPSLLFSNNRTDVNKTVDFTYYLGPEEGRELVSVANSMNKLSVNGYKVTIRPHPRYTDIEYLKRYTKNLEIENVKSITIEESLRRTKNAISCYSTVLNQAYNNNVSIVIDDVINKERFKKLIEVQYIMVKKEHKLLSEFVS